MHALLCIAEASSRLPQRLQDLRLDMVNYNKQHTFEVAARLVRGDGIITVRDDVSRDLQVWHESVFRERAARARAATIRPAMPSRRRKPYELRRRRPRQRRQNGEPRRRRRRRDANAGGGFLANEAQDASGNDDSEPDTEPE